MRMMKFWNMEALKLRSGSATQLSIVHISTDDGTKGASRAAYRLHRGLLQVGVASRMLVANKRADDDSVVLPDLSRRLDHRLRRRTQRQLISIDQRRIARCPRSEFFSLARSARYIGCWDEAVRNASVLNLHFVVGFVDYPSFFAALPPGKPLVWTLHDINPLTGGCHYAGSCEKFTSRCGACPQLGSTREHDLSRRGFDIKAKAYARLHADRVVLVAPSTWVAAEAQRSALLGRFRVKHIPNGLDLDVFRPRDRKAARKAFGIQADERVILFVSDSLRNHRKGLDLLLSAIESVEAKANLVLASVGDGATPEIGGIRRLHVGRIDSDYLLSLFYNIADVFVIPSREDNLPQTAVEATACGCPVVGFDIGGLSDIIEEGQTGFLTAPFDIRQLRDAIEATIVRRDAFSAACRLRAERLFGLETQVKAYQSLYSEILKLPSEFEKIES
jgi:glycosyltransferase involved in cell wall biosynthesis